LILLAFFVLQKFYQLESGGRPFPDRKEIAAGPRPPSMARPGGAYGIYAIVKERLAPMHGSLVLPSRSRFRREGMAFHQKMAGSTQAIWRWVMSQ